MLGTHTVSCPPLLQLHINDHESALDTVMYTLVQGQILIKQTCAVTLKL